MNWTLSIAAAAALVACWFGAKKIQAVWRVPFWLGLIDIVLVLVLLGTSAVGLQ